MVGSLTVRQAAERLGCTTKYVFDMLYSNLLEGARKVGRRWAIPAAAVEARLKARKAQRGANRGQRR